MLSLRFTVLGFLVLLTPINNINAGPVSGNWSSVPIFPQTPLETRLGTFSDTVNPNALGMILWNDGVNNRLDAVTIPAPYDGTGITSTALENTPTLFALGDICTQGNNVVVAYIRNFDVGVARFDGDNWSTSTIPGTQTNNFDSADCAVTNNGIFVAGHDLTDSETEIFRSTDGGNNYTFYGRYTNVSGPFDGAVREPLGVIGSTSIAMTLNQQPSGQIRATHFDTSQNPPNFTHTDIVMLPPPPGMFTFVKESGARSSADTFFFTYNADGNARTVDVPANNPAAFSHRNLGPVNNNGSQFTFQSGNLINIQDENGTTIQNSVLWGDYFIVDTNPLVPPETDMNYPLAGVGGPSDGCFVQNDIDSWQAIIIGPRVGSAGTDLHKRDLPAPSFFASGFESGETSIWSACD